MGVVGSCAPAALAAAGSVDAEDVGSGGGSGQPGGVVPASRVGACGSAAKVADNTGSFWPPAASSFLSSAAEVCRSPGSLAIAFRMIRSSHGGTPALTSRGRGGCSERC